MGATKGALIMCNSCFELAELVHDPNYRPNPIIEIAVFETLDKMPHAEEMTRHDKAVFLICLGAHNLFWQPTEEVNNG